MIGFSSKRSWFVVVMLSVWPFSIAGAQPIHKNTPSATEGYLPGYFALGAQDYQSAAGFFQMLLKQHPGDTAVQRQLFLALCQIGQIKEAGALVESLRKEKNDLAQQAKGGPRIIFQDPVKSDQPNLLKSKVDVGTTLKNNELPIPAIKRDLRNNLYFAIAVIGVLYYLKVSNIGYGFIQQLVK